MQVQLAWGGGRPATCSGLSIRADVLQNPRENSETSMQRNQTGTREIVLRTARDPRAGDRSRDTGALVPALFLGSSGHLGKWLTS